MLYVYRLGVHRGRRPRRRRGLLFGPPSKIPEPKVTGMRWRISTSLAGASSRGGRVCERKCVRRSTLVRTRSKKFCRLNARFYSSLNAEDTVESATRTFPSPESDSWPVSRPFINEEATIEVGPCVGVPANDSEVKKGKECSPLNANAIRTSRTLLHPYADECGGYTSYPA